MVVVIMMINIRSVDLMTLTLILTYN